MISKEYAYKIVMERVQSELLFSPFDSAEYISMDDNHYVFIIKTSRRALIGTPLFYLVDQQGRITSYRGSKYYHLIKHNTSLKKTIKNFFCPYRGLVKATLDLFFLITKKQKSNLL